jgi:hypothetical protein
MSSYQQPIAHQHNPNIKQLYLDRILQFTQTGQLIPTNTEPFNPGTRLQYGTEFILAIAMCVSAITGLLKVIKQR